MLINSLVSHFPELLEGAKITLLLSVLALILSFIWGLVIYLLRESKYLRYLGDGYFEFFRNTPLLVQMFFIYFGSSYININLGSFESALIALTLQHGALFSELYKTGLKAVSPGQLEASSALGLTKVQSMRLVMFPQAIRKIVPWLSNQSTLLIKDTSVASGISVMELTLMGSILSEKTANSFVIFVGIALIYLTLNAIVSLAFNLSERQYD